MRCTDKQAKYAHQTVDEFKKYQDEKKIISALRTSRKVSGEEISAEKVRRLHKKLKLLEKKNETLETQKVSPYKSFFYSLPEKQAFVQAKLDEKNIPYRETENGFEAQECYVEEIRKIEKEFKPTSSVREKIRENIDRLLMQSASVDELLEKLRKEKYEIKHGKYLAVKSPESKNFVRLKSLGEHYSEYALRNRINAKKKYEREIEKFLDRAKSNLKTFYELKEKLEIVFENKKSGVFTIQQAEATLKKYPNINSGNYHNVDILIKNETENVRQTEENLKSAQENFRQSADIYTIACR